MRARGVNRVRIAIVGLAVVVLALAAVCPLGQRAAAVEETSALDALLPTTGRVATQPAPAPATVAASPTPVAPAAPATTPGGWSRFINRPIIRQARSVVAWVGSLMRFLWSIPQALFRGDSRGMIDALGDLLSKSSPERRSGSGGSSGGSRSAADGDSGGRANFSFR